MNKKLKLTLFLLLMLICIATTNVHATYQSRSEGTVVRNELINGTTGFMTTVRQMEGSGQVMGLSESINTSSGASTSGSNNIDVHMQKNTEYGAMVILGVSDYGKQTGYIHNTTGGLATTTGNKSGVYELGKSPEWVSGLAGGVSHSYNSKYFNSYSISQSLQHRGDATIETLNSTTNKGWQEAGNASWVSSGHAFCRAVGSGAFSYKDNGSPDRGTYAGARTLRHCLWHWILTDSEW